MTKQEQIEELKNILLEESNRFYGLKCDEACAYCEASAVYNAGYRKQSEAAKEIFDAIKSKLIFNKYGIATISYETFCDLRNKYTGEQQ